MRNHGVTVHAEACDIGDANQLQGFVSRAADRLGGIDILINNACYIAHPLALEEYEDEIFEQSLSIGLVSVYRAMRFAFPHLKQRNGRIVNFTSIGGLRGARGQAGYGAAKTGLIGLTRVAAADWARFGITVNCIAPMAMSDAWQAYLDTQPTGLNPFHAVGVHENVVGRPGDPEADVAPAVAFLCSEAGRFITGCILPVDGGLLDLE